MHHRRRYCALQLCVMIGLTGLRPLLSHMAIKTGKVIHIVSHTSVCACVVSVFWHFNKTAQRSACTCVQLSMFYRPVLVKLVDV